MNADSMRCVTRCHTHSCSAPMHPYMRQVQVCRTIKSEVVLRGMRTAGGLQTMYEVPSALPSACPVPMPKQGGDSVVASSMAPLEQQEEALYRAHHTSSTGSLNLLRPVESVPCIAAEDPEYQAWRVRRNTRARDTGVYSRRGTPHACDRCGDALRDRRC
jgi:hypothetical protein